MPVVSVRRVYVAMNAPIDLDDGERVVRVESEPDTSKFAGRLCVYILRGEPFPYEGNPGPQ